MKKLLSILKYIFFLGLGISLAWWQFNKMTAAQRLQFSDSLQQVNYWLILPVIIMSILSHISRAMRWKILIEPMGYQPSTSNTFYAVMCGYLANTFLPRAGEVLKCSLLNKYERIPMNKLIGTILIERGFDLLCYVLLIAFTILIQVDFVGVFVKEKFAEMKSGGSPKILLIIIIMAVSIVLMAITINWIFKKYAHKNIIQTFSRFYSGLKEGLHTIRFLKRRTWFIAHTFFIWCMYLLQIYIGFSALVPTSHLGITEASSVLSLATLGMIVSPGGIGAFPIAVQEVLLIYNVDNVSFGWLIWGISTAIVIIAGSISFMILVYKNRNRNEIKSTPLFQDLQH